MEEYGEPADIIERVFDCVTTSKNAYINKLVLKQLRAISRLHRQGQVLTSELYRPFIEVTRSWKPEEETEKMPISEILQIFA